MNVINKATKLVGAGNAPRLIIDNNGSGVALRLLVEPGKPPMQVNSSAKVARLNADSLDGKDSTQFVSGYNVVTVSGDFNSNALRTESAFCPSGQQALGGGAFVSTSATGSSQSSSLNVALTSSSPNSVGPPARAWVATADEMVDTNTNWRLVVYAMCANTGP